MSLPQEIVEIIIDAADDTNAWRQCGLACRAWTPISQRLLFRDITIEISSRKSQSSPTTRLVSIIKQSPHLSDVVQEICIASNLARWNITKEQQQQQELLAVLIASFTHLTKLSLVSEGYEYFSDLESPLRNSIQSLLNSPNMKHVVLDGWTFVDLSHFIALMGTSTKYLSNLEFHEIRIDSPPTSTDILVQKQGIPRVLHRLIIDMPYEYAEAWLNTLVHPLSVKSLHLYGGWGHASNILAWFSADLEELTLVQDEDENYFAIDFNSPLDRLSKLVLKLPICNILYEILDSIPERNCIRTLEIHGVVHDELVKFRESFREHIDALVTSRQYSHLQTILINCSYPETDITASDFEIINETFRCAVGQGVLFLHVEGTGVIHDSTQIKLKALGNL